MPQIPVFHSFSAQCSLCSKTRLKNPRIGSNRAHDSDAPFDAFGLNHNLFCLARKTLPKKQSLSLFRRTLLITSFFVCLLLYLLTKHFRVWTKLFEQHSPRLQIDTWNQMHVACALEYSTAYCKIIWITWHIYLSYHIYLSHLFVCYFRHACTQRQRQRNFYIFWWQTTIFFIHIGIVLKNVSPNCNSTPFDRPNDLPTDRTSDTAHRISLQIISTKSMITEQWNNLTSSIEWAQMQLIKWDTTAHSIGPIDQIQSTIATCNMQSNAIFYLLLAHFSASWCIFNLHNLLFSIDKIPYLKYVPI